jgi:hypothetical protein
MGASHEQMQLVDLINLLPYSNSQTGSAMDGGS